MVLTAFVLKTQRHARADKGFPVSLRLVLFGVLALVLAPPIRAAAQELEYAVKATYLCKLPAFVNWPATAQQADSFVLCVVGLRPFGELLENAARGQTVQERPIVVRRYPVIAANPGCQLMFIAGSDGQTVAAALAAVHGAPVLTVTDGQSDAASTGIINFVLIDNHVRFEIDQRLAADAGLVISSKLLSLASRVRNRSAP